MDIVNKLSSMDIIQLVVLLLVLYIVARFFTAFFPIVAIIACLGFLYMKGFFKGFMAGQTEGFNKLGVQFVQYGKPRYDLKGNRLNTMPYEDYIDMIKFRYYWPFNQVYPFEQSVWSNRNASQ